ncbi:magnesium transporter [Moritella viscosa]|uniref:Magnesium transporter MgtE n=1 Tax=Moritella viscosa TaxID=80854 RepID=A0A090INK5_9GAMM|nr:magnesium transporter [Moritella viscosa]CED62099.1 magnesium transporter [Moritella viscosa]SGY92279.1 Putative magnesium transporter [Moritella viscosa]SGY96691.1 Putative magnesium transporter [Moritella viscosa]SGY97148.1 Putative magnesium transporter [Moritella viscosa]SGZ02398.1 Putative magnesium transporter [Moritella viscosa]
MPEKMEHDSTHLRLSEVNEALDSGMFVHVKRMLYQTPPCDIALLLESSPPACRKVLWRLTDSEMQGEILDELNEDAKTSILKMMDTESLVAATEGLDTDDLANILRSLPDSIYQEVITQMDTQDRQRLETAMAYPEDTAGSIMDTDTITLRPDVTVDVILRYIRLRGELPEATDTLYVVDKDDRLIGDVPLAMLLTTDPNSVIRTIMDREAETLPANMDTSEIAKLFERHDWISAPVIDDSGKLLGRITIDDVVDIIRENAEHDMMGMAGMDDDEDTFAPVMQSTKRRTLWLGVNLIAALTAASVSNMFEATLEQLATLAILMTIVPSMGGIAGNQTLALVIRGMAVGHINDDNSRWLIGKEAMVGALNGAIWAISIAIIVSLWKGDPSLGLIIGGAMFINMAMGGLAGVVIPLAMKKYNIDPALAGGMALTTVTDVVGLFAFLGMATLVYG